MISPPDRHRKLIRREPLKHDKWASRSKPFRFPPRLDLQRKFPMTVCIAALCQFPSPSGEGRRVAITATDRQITGGELQSERPQIKESFQPKLIGGFFFG